MDLSTEFRSSGRSMSKYDNIYIYIYIPPFLVCHILLFYNIYTKQIVDHDMFNI